MGGYGSGRLWGFSQVVKVEDARALDIAALARAGYLRAGVRMCGSWKWWVVGSEDRPSTVSVEFNLATSLPLYRIRYTVQSTGERIDVGGHLVRTSPNYGGTRWWFACTLCQRRVRKLHLGHDPPIFACRKCHHLRYTSQSESLADRLLRKAHKLYRRAGSSTNGTTFTVKPKGMHWTTFDRLMDEAEGCLERSMFSHPIVSRWILPELLAKAKLR